MQIKILRLGHSATVIEVPAGTTIEEGLTANDIPRQGYSVSVNGLGAGPATALGDGDVVTLIPKVEGGEY
jgi:molybdopterin converting factor small subunit